MSELTKRLREHAALHGDIGKFNDEQAQWERDLLDAADYIDNDEASGVHTCHGHCKRLACVQRREIERLRYAIKMERGKTEKADEDNERLRGLLRELDECGAVANWLRVSDDLRARVRAALGTPAGHESGQSGPMDERMLDLTPVGPGRTVDDALSDQPSDDVSQPTANGG